MSRRGFTFVEMLIVMIVIGILASIAVLKYMDLRNHAVAAGIARAIETVRLGAYNHWADHDSFPAEAGSGIVPAAMVGYLPQNFGFTRPQFSYDWDNFGAGGGGYQVGLTVSVSDARLQTLVMRSFEGRYPFFRSGDNITYIIVGPNGKM